MCGGVEVGGKDVRVVVDVCTCASSTYSHIPHPGREVYIGTPAGLYALLLRGRRGEERSH